MRNLNAFFKAYALSRSALFAYHDAYFKRTGTYKIAKHVNFIFLVLVGTL